MSEEITNEVYENSEEAEVEESLLPLLQALLISSTEPLDLTTLASVCESEEPVVEEALKLLSAKLESDAYGFELVAIAKGYQFRTKAKFGRFIRTLKQESPRKLSPAALETLAVIAYRQPVVKHDIDGLRGVDVLPTLKTLMDRNLVHVIGHRESVGRPALYATTDEFLRVFGLNSIEDLPTIKELNQIQVEPGEGAQAFDNTSFEVVAEVPAS